MNTLDSSLLAELPSFSGLSKSDLSALLEQAKSSRFERGQHIFDQGEPAHHFYVLLDGHIRVVKVTPGGEQIIARYVSTGELFGIAQAIGKGVYPANAVAAVDCVVLSWPSSIWQEMVERYPAFAANTYAAIGSRLLEAQDRIVEMSTERVEQRVASALMNLVTHNGKKTAEGILIDFPISRQDISEMTGTTLHTVSRLLSAWEHDGLVKSGRQKIMVTRGDELLLVANGGRAR